MAERLELETTTIQNIPVLTFEKLKDAAPRALLIMNGDCGMRIIQTS
jgi:hypothetical protein